MADEEKTVADLTASLRAANSIIQQFNDSQSKLKSTTDKVSASIKDNTVNQKESTKNLKDAWKEQEAVIKKEIAANEGNAVVQQNLREQISRTELRFSELENTIESADFETGFSALKSELHNVPGVIRDAEDRINSIEFDIKETDRKENNKLLEDISDSIRKLSAEQAGLFAVLGGTMEKSIAAISPDLIPFLETIKNVTQKAWGWMPFKQWRENRKQAKIDKRREKARDKYFKAQMAGKPISMSEAMDQEFKDTAGHFEKLSANFNSGFGMFGETSEQMKKAYVEGYMGLEKSLEKNQGFGQGEFASDKEKEMRESIEKRNIELAEERTALNNQQAEAQKELFAEKQRLNSIKDSFADSGEDKTAKDHERREIKANIEKQENIFKEITEKLEDPANQQIDFKELEKTLSIIASKEQGDFETQETKDADEYLSKMEKTLDQSFGDPKTFAKDMGFRGSPPYLETLVELFEKEHLPLLKALVDKTTGESTTPKAPEAPEIPNAGAKLENLGSGILDGIRSFIDGLTTIVQSSFKFFQAFIDGISNVISKVAKVISKTFIQLMTGLGQGISALFTALGSIPLPALAIGAAALGVLTVSLMGMGLALKMMAPFVTAVLGGMVKIFGAIGKVIKVVGQVITNFMTSLVDNIIKLTQVPFMSFLKLAGAFAALGAGLGYFGLTSMIAIPSLLALGVASLGLSKLLEVLPPDQMFAMADGFKVLAAAVKSFGLSSLFLIPAVALLTALSMIPFANKLVDLQLKKAKVDQSASPELFTADTLQVGSVRTIAGEALMSGNDRANQLNAETQIGSGRDMEGKATIATQMINNNETTIIQPKTAVDRGFMDSLISIQQLTV